MSKRKRITTHFLLALRSIGLLCKKRRPHKYEIRTQSTIYPEGWGTTYRSIDAEQHNWIEMKKQYRRGCMFDNKTRTCPCGVTGVEQFAVGCKDVTPKNK
jgi:hypothetical protein